MFKSLTQLPIFSSIRSKLIALLLVLVGFPLFIAGYLSYQSATDALLKQTTQQLGNLADKTAQQIDYFFQSAKKDINLLANYPFIQLAFLQYEFKQRLDTVQRLLVDYSKKNDYFSRIYLVDLHGRPILTVPSTDLDQHDFHKDQWFAQTLQNGIYLSDDISLNADSPAGIFLSKVIFDFEDSSQPVGVLAFHIKSSAYTDFARSLHIGSGGYAVLMHYDGKVIHHPDQRFRSKQDIIKNGDDRLEIHIQQMTQGKNGYGRYSFFGEEKFLVYTSCRERPWSVGITVMEAELMADINRFQKKMLTFFLVIILLILPISFLFIKGLTRPIKELIDGANRIGSGDLDQTIHIESNDELRDVAEEFNKMAIKLKSSMEGMLRVEKLASLGELSAGVAHEIRNPLAGIKTSVQVLKKRVIKAESKELLSGVESEINRLDKIVTDLLRFSRPTTPLPEPLDIIGILEMTLDLMSERIKTLGISIERRFNKQVPKAIVDREQIQQVFLNLLLNSIKAMETGGRLTIEVHPGSEAPNGLGRYQNLSDLQLSRYIKVVFADTGHGIASQHMQKIFDPFFTTDPKGTGLGLSIAHKLIEENNGHIFLYSIKGQGTQVILLLPLVQKEEK